MLERAEDAQAIVAGALEGAPARAVAADERAVDVEEVEHYLLRGARRQIAQQLDQQRQRVVAAGDGARAIVHAALRPDAEPAGAQGAEARARGVVEERGVEAAAIARGEASVEGGVAGLDGRAVGARAEAAGVAPLDGERRIARQRLADDDVDAADEPAVTRQRQLHRHARRRRRVQAHRLVAGGARQGSPAAHRRRRRRGAGCSRTPRATSAAGARAPPTRRRRAGPAPPA